MCCRALIGSVASKLGAVCMLQLHEDTDVNLGTEFNLINSTFLPFLKKYISSPCDCRNYAGSVWLMTAA